MKKLIPLAFIVALPLGACNTAQQAATCDLVNIAAVIAEQNSKAARVQQASNYAQLCPAIATDIAALAPAATTTK